MLSEKDHKGYKAEELLNDDNFVRWCLSPTSESDAYWVTMKENDLSLSEEIVKARTFIMYLRRDLHTPEFTERDEQELWRRIRHKNEWYLSRKKIVHNFRWVAVAVLVVCVWGLWKYKSVSVLEPNYLAVMESIENVTNTSNDVQLVLGEGKKVCIQEKESRVEYTSDGEVTVNSKAVNSMKESAAAYAPSSLNQLIVPYGKRSSIIFSDGTMIWVNSGSKVIYPTHFNRKRREIFIEGEAYLKVVHESSIPFVVKTRLLDVLVHGTTFNVSAYKNDANLQVTLVEGKVEISAKGISTELKPSQQFALNTADGKAKIRTVDINNYIAWKKGYYIFEKEPLSQVFKRLSRYYDVQIECDEQVGRMTCSGKLDLKTQIDDVLGYLQKAAPIQVNEKGEKLIVSRIYKK